MSTYQVKSVQGRTAKVMVATTSWGEFEYKTAGVYDVAGVIQYTAPDGKLVREIAAVGTSWASVRSRTIKVLRAKRPGTLPSDYPYLMEVVSMTEATAPVIRKYFGRHGLTVTSVFTEDGGWQEANLHTGRTLLRLLAKDGVKAIVVSKGLGRGNGRKDADFQIDEVIKSMNSRKKAS